MKSPALVADYIPGSKARLAAIDVLYARESWADARKARRDARWVVETVKAAV